MTAAKTQVVSTEYERVPLDKIKIGRVNVRTVDQQKGIDDLSDSIAKYGLLQPIVVFRSNGDYELVVGQRRTLACQALVKAGNEKFKTIPAVIYPKVQDEEYLKVISLSENIQRVELNRADIVDVVSYLYKKHNKSAKEVAKILGKSVPYVYDYLKIQDAPDVIKTMWQQKKINKEDVKRIMEIAPGDEKKMVTIAKSMSDMTKPEKERLVDVGRTKRDSTATELIREAKKPRIEEKVLVSLTPKLSLALEVAVKKIGLSREEIAKRAIEEWLFDKGFTGVG